MRPRDLASLMYSDAGFSGGPIDLSVDLVWSTTAGDAWALWYAGDAIIEAGVLPVQSEDCALKYAGDPYEKFGEALIA
jgi:hypothetical protein